MKEFGFTVAAVVAGILVVEIGRKVLSGFTAKS